MAERLAFGRRPGKEWGVSLAERGVRPHLLARAPELIGNVQFYVHMGQGAASPLNSRAFDY